MRRVVKRAPRSYKVKCSRCGAVFTYELEDLRRNYLMGCECVACPSCGEEHPHYNGSTWGG